MNCDFHNKKILNLMVLSFNNIEILDILDEKIKVKVAVYTVLPPIRRKPVFSTDT
jgi:hypothetical protein